MFLQAQEAMGLAAQIAVKTANAHSESSVLRAVTEALDGYVQWVWVELNERVSSETSVKVLGLTSESREIYRSQRTVLLNIVSSENNFIDCITDFQSSHQSRFTSEIERARKAQGSMVIIFSLESTMEVQRYCSIALASNSRLLDSTALDVICHMIRSALRHAQVVTKVAALSRRAHVDRDQLRMEIQKNTSEKSFIVTSGVMRKLIDETVDVVAKHPTTVLLRGESGVGKEMLARYIHDNSPRFQRSMLKVNCGALPEQLVESVLFGHERGAFTGATQRHIGYFERANNSTLFLDEIAELSLATQVKLLRVLQENEFERIGGDTTIKVDVRLIAATHRSLEDMVAKQLFREDLYYRINVFPIRVPSLRERLEDLPSLATGLLTKIAQRLNKSVPRVTDETLARLCSYHWPGNVRELENILERSVILSPANVLMLPQDFANKLTTQLPMSQRITLKDAVAQTIEQALTKTKGKIHGPSGASVLLGMKATTLQSKMKKLGILRKRFIK